MDEITLFAELAPAPPTAADGAAARDRARARLAVTLAGPPSRTGAGRGTGQWFSRRRILLGAVAGLTAAAAAVVVPAVLPDGGPPSVTTRAWAVEPAGHGTVRVTVRELLDPAGLERALRAQGVPAYVQFLPGTVRRKGNLYVAPVCRYTRNGAPLRVSPRESQRVFTIPSDTQSSRISLFIHPAAIPTGTAVLIWIQGTPPLEQHQDGWSNFADDFALVEIGHLPHCTAF
jgi:hypothetical protein